MSAGTSQTEGGKKSGPLTAPFTFTAVIILVFVTSAWVLDGLGLTPSGTNDSATTATTIPSQTNAVATPVAVVGDLPVSLSIPKINLQVTVANPSTTDVDALDAALLKGAVRYPGTGSLGDEGNVIIFGHSSYLPVVHNKAYKTFDGIQNLVKGDQILVQGSKGTYVYVVETVAQANATTDGIPDVAGAKQLTLVTCDSFATKSDRYVVIANLVESHPLSS